MSKSIMTLAHDVYHVLDSEQPHEPTPELAGLAASRIAGEMASATLLRDKPREIGNLWASDLGKSCYRQQWYKFNDNKEAEPLLGHTKFKFLYGTLIEEALLYLAEEAGHNVEHTQARVEYTHENGWKVSGRIDAVIDGALTDVKSTSTYGYAKYKKEGLTMKNDSFGYRWQLGFYENFNDFGSSITDPDNNGFTWVEKQNGHILHTPTKGLSKQAIRSKIALMAESIELPKAPEIHPSHASVPDGKSGNTKLCIQCQYCDFKYKCRPNIRTFLYSTGPRHLEVVKKAPMVQEIKR